MEKKVNEYRGDDIFKGVIPFDSDYVHSFTPQNVENVTIKMRPQTKGEKRDVRRLSALISFAVAEGKDYTGEMADLWEIIGGTILEWDFKDANKKLIQFSIDAFELLPDWLKIKITDESKKISGLMSVDHRFLES